MIIGLALERLRRVLIHGFLMMNVRMITFEALMG